MTRTAQVNLRSWLDEAWNNKMILSHVIRRMQMVEDWPVIGSKLTESIRNTASLPSVQEQADNLIRWLGDNHMGPGERVRVNNGTHGGMIGTLTTAGFNFIIRGLVGEELIEANDTLPDGSDIELTFKGWRRWEELRRGAPSGTKAFMAMGYGDPSADRIAKEYFRPAVAATGFSLVRLDDEPKAGLIDDRMRVEIQSARFLIADLTHGNSGAYWEAGYAEGLGKPVIYTCEESFWKNQKIHFDTNHRLHIVWSEGEITTAMERLKATIRVTIPESKRGES